MAEPNSIPGKPTPDDPRKDAPIKDPPVHPEHDSDKPDKVLYDENRAPG
jgi:hypothetical protein